MNVSEVKAFCRSMSMVEERETAGNSNMLVYRIGEKKFAYFKTSDPEKWRFSFRVTPQRFVELTDQPGIKPARYMGRYYWVTVVNVSSVDEGYLTELIRWSYQYTLSRLPKRVQKLIDA